MPARAHLSAALLGAAAILLLPAPAMIGGDGRADAKEFYTKKRVNGRWVAGRFPSDSARTGGAKRAAATKTAKAKPGHGRRRLAARAVAPEPETEARPMPPPRPFANEPMAAPLSPPVSSVAPVTAAAQPLPMRGDSVISTASITPAPSEARLERMRPALEAHARTLASDAPASGPAGLPPTPPAPVGVAVRSMTFDFERGTQTTVFDDAASLTEPLDPGRARDLAKAAAPQR